jgi:lipopolysaccharide transport system ATP-binding protein
LRCSPVLEADWIDNAFVFDVEEGDFFDNGKVVPSNQSKLLFDFNLKY